MEKTLHEIIVEAGEGNVAVLTGLTEAAVKLTNDQIDFVQEFLKKVPQRGSALYEKYKDAKKFVLENHNIADYPFHGFVADVVYGELVLS